MTVPRIGIWGPSEAGKTSYIACLPLAVWQNQEREWSIEPKNSRAADFLEQASASLKQGMFPYATPLQDGLYEYIFHIKHKNRELDLCLVDAAGGLIGKDDAETNFYFSHLMECSGIILMIDPDAKPGYIFGGEEWKKEDYFSTLSRLIRYLKETSANKDRITTKLAFCITKVDLDKHWRRKDNKDSFLQSVIGVEAYNRIYDVCDPDNIHISTISVVGRYQTPTNHERPNIIQYGDQDQYRIAQPTKWKPYQVLNPLKWLLSKLNKRWTIPMLR